MEKARLRSQWLQTANILCMMANINRDSKTRRTPYEPYEFMPFDTGILKPDKHSIRGFASAVGGKTMTVKEYLKYQEEQRKCLHSPMQ